MTPSHDVRPALVDLRSDTVTRPTEAMYERMRAAPIGDDGLDGDPTVRELEAEVAGVLGKEAGLFVASCTMANLLAVLTQSRPQEQIVLEASAHMITSERGSATFTGLSYVGLPGEGGAMDLDALDEALQPKSHGLRTAIVATETSHNNAGGAVPPVAHMRAVRSRAVAAGAVVHLDGARLFNAAVALDLPPAAIAEHADTVSLCLCKGLSAPVGAVLAGPRATINRAREVRRMIGGTQRQAGIMAAAGLEAVRRMGPRLADDHRRAAQLSAALNGWHPRIYATVPQTNIVQVDVGATGRSSADWVADLERAGLAVRPWGRHRIRCVTHREIDDAAIEVAIGAFRTVAEMAEA